MKETIIIHFVNKNKHIIFNKHTTFPQILLVHHSLQFRISFLILEATKDLFVWLFGTAPTTSKFKIKIMIDLNQKVANNSKFDFLCVPFKIKVDSLYPFWNPSFFYQPTHSVSNTIPFLLFIKTFISIQETWSLITIISSFINDQRTFRKHCEREMKKNCFNLIQII